MKVLIISQYFWPENFRITDVAQGLRDLGHEVTVLTGLPNYPDGRFFAGYGLRGPWRDKHEGIEVIRAPLVPRGNGGGPRLICNYLSFVAGSILFGLPRLRERFDALLVFEPSPVTVAIPALLLKTIQGTPLLFWVQDLWPESLSATGMVKNRMILRAVASLVRLIYRHSDRILIQSRAFREPIRALGAEDQRIVYLPNSAEALYQPVELPADAPERLLVPAGFRIMFAGNIGAAQSFSTIIDAADLLREFADVHWIILGDGRMRGEAEAEVEARGLGAQVHFLGQHAPAMMPRFFALADVLLVTLRRDPIFAATLPSKLQSYLACGRPIVAALDGEGARVLEESGAGIAVPSDDPRALADAVRRLRAARPEERAKMGSRGRAYFEAEFDRGMLLRRLQDCMAEVAGGPERTR